MGVAQLLWDCTAIDLDTCVQNPEVGGEVEGVVGSSQWAAQGGQASIGMFGILS